MKNFNDLWAECRTKVAQLAYQVSRGGGGAERRQLLISVGQIALWEVSRRFDESRNTAFWTYARPRVLGAMRDELRSLDHVNRDGRNKLKEGGSGIDPWALLFPCTLRDAVEVAAQTDPESEAIRGETSELLSRLVRKLPEKLQHVVRGSFYADRSLAEIASQLGISEARASQMRSEAVSLLREMILKASGVRIPAKL